MNILDAKPVRVEIVWRRFLRCRIEHAIERKILYDSSDPRHVVAVEWAVGLCGSIGAGFPPPCEFAFYRRCKKCIELAKEADQ